MMSQLKERGVTRSAAEPIKMQDFSDVPTLSFYFDWRRPTHPSPILTQGAKARTPGPSKTLAMAMLCAIAHHESCRTHIGRLADETPQMTNGGGLNKRCASPSARPPKPRQDSWPADALCARAAN